MDGIVKEAYLRVCSHDGVKKSRVEGTRRGSGGGEGEERGGGGVASTGDEEEEKRSGNGREAVADKKEGHGDV